MTALKYFYGIAGLTTLANGLWMLVSPETWYGDIPAEVPDTGPLNGHFVRDIGVAFSVMGLGLLWCARHLDRCRVVHLGVTAFFAGHALVHVVEMLTGSLSPTHWWIDFPLVFAPAILLVVLALPPVWRRVSGVREFLMVNC